MIFDEYCSEIIKMKESQLILVGGRPAMGKTGLAISFSLKYIKEGLRVAYFSLGASKEELTSRFTYKEKDVDIMQRLFIYDDCSDLNVINKICQENKFDIVIIDYLQLIDRGDFGINEVQIRLKEFAEDICSPVIILSQITREVENRPDHKPMIEDLILTQIYEEYYDEVILLYRDYYYDRSADNKSKIDLIMKDKEISFVWDYESLSVK